jgi:hypothetical protein
MLKLGFVYVWHCSGACFAVYVFMILTVCSNLTFVRLKIQKGKSEYVNLRRTDKTKGTKWQATMNKKLHRKLR